MELTDLIVQVDKKGDYAIVYTPFGGLAYEKQEDGFAYDSLGYGQPNMLTKNREIAMFSDEAHSYFEKHKKEGDKLASEFHKRDGISKKLIPLHDQIFCELKTKRKRAYLEGKDGLLSYLLLPPVLIVTPFIASMSCHSKEDGAKDFFARFVDGVGMSISTMKDLFGMSVIETFKPSAYKTTARLSKTKSENTVGLWLQCPDGFSIFRSDLRFPDGAKPEKFQIARFVLPSRIILYENGVAQQGNQNGFYEFPQLECPKDLINETQKVSEEYLAIQEKIGHFLKLTFDYQEHLKVLKHIEL